jgi:nicotinamidase-related amidase
MITALLLVEFQDDYFTNGKSPLVHSHEASQHAQLVAGYFREQGFPVIHIPQISTHPNARDLLPCTKGAEIHALLQPRKGEQVIKKHYPNAFKDTHLLNYLHKNHVKDLVICGMMTQLAIDSTVRAARDYGFSCTVLSDACAAKELTFNHRTIQATEVHAAFLAALYPKFAKISSTQDYLQRVQQPLSMTG